MSYPSESNYQVYSIERILQAGHTTIYGLVQTNTSLESEEDAESWIEQNGERHIKYTILKVYSKP